MKLVDIFLGMLTARPKMQGEDAFHRSGDGIILPDHVHRQRAEEITP